MTNPSPSSNHDSPPSADEPNPTRWVEVAVAVVFRRVAGGVELLIARRHAEAVRGGLWEFPGGKIEPGEHASAAALREVEEEVGLGAAEVTGAPHALTVVAHTDPTVVREKSVRLHAFLVEVRADAHARALGSGEVRWIGVAELESFDWPPANAAINDAVRSEFRSAESGRLSPVSARLRTLRTADGRG